MKYNPQVIQQLLLDVEAKFDRRCQSPADFIQLSARIKEVKGEQISDSTLKRLWGYAKSDSVPRLSTLTTIARYLGYRDWDDYQVALVKENRVESDFISPVSTTSTMTSDLTVGQRLRIEWRPDREITVTYLGQERFRVDEAGTSKLQPGDTFRTAIFRKGTPLICLDLRRQADALGTYIAGEANGLTRITLLTSR